MADLEKLREWLESQGFKIANNSVASEVNQCRWYAWRRSSLPARRCECNDDKEGAQIVVTPHSMTFQAGEQLYESVEVEICGQAGGAWYKLKAYSLSMNELPQQLPQIEAALVRAWNALEPSNG
jgi:hypothetical protein